MTVVVGTTVVVVTVVVTVCGRNASLVESGCTDHSSTFSYTQFLEMKMF